MHPYGITFGIEFGTMMAAMSAQNAKTGLTLW
jgi:hypothetical protein